MVRYSGEVGAEELLQSLLEHVRGRRSAEPPEAGLGASVGSSDSRLKIAVRFAAKDGLRNQARDKGYRRADRYRTVCTSAPDGSQPRPRCESSGGEPTSRG